MTEVDELFQKVPSSPDQVLERVAFLRQYLVEHPESALAWAMLGATSVLYLDRGENLRCYERAHELEPNEFGWLWGIARNTNLGVDPSTAVQTLGGLPWVPRMFDLFEHDFYGVLGSEAIPLLKRGALLDPLNPLIWIELGWCFLEQELKDEAEAAFDQASLMLGEQWHSYWEAGDPGVIEWLIKFSRQGHRLAWGYKRLGNAEGCVRQARLALDAWQAVGWNPQRQERSLVDMLEVHQCYEDVARYCEVAFSIEGRACTSFEWDYVWALVGLGKIDAALDFHRTHRDDANAFYVAVTLAAGLRDAGRLDEALGLLEEWMTEVESPRRYSRNILPDFWHELAEVREALGDSEGVREARERAAAVKTD